MSKNHMAISFLKENIDDRIFYLNSKIWTRNERNIIYIFYAIETSKDLILHVIMIDFNGPIM